MLSALLHNIYVDGLFKRLRKKKIGCCIDGTYLGILGYADDIFLLGGLQSIINTCVQYINGYRLKFITNEDPKKCKTECRVLLAKERDLGKLTLDGVDSAKHLENNEKCKRIKQDKMEKRARYIRKK